jgi:hypothetical protein
MSRRRFAVRLVLLSGAAIVLMTPLSGSESSRPEQWLFGSRFIVVRSATELVAALSTDTGKRTIFVRPGTYQLGHAIRVPDHTRLIGDGMMMYDDSGLPMGFVSEGTTVIAATPGVTGDFVTLGDGASLRGLVIQDVVRPALTGGSPVVVSSTGPGESVSAQVVECEIINPNPVTGPGLTGPVGRGLLAITRNRPDAGAASHEQSRVSVHLTQSVIRSPGGGDGIFLINNASGSHIVLHVRRNVIGKLGANGGVSRPDSTVGATTSIQSIGNLYRADTTPTSIGWQINGGSDAPMLAPLIAEDTLNNKLSIHSVDDRIEGFGSAIVAAAGRRMSASAGAIASNEMELILIGTRLASTTTDLNLYGARNLAGPADSNELRVTMWRVTGSGPRANDYGDAASNLGTGNRLIITGNLDLFSRTNEAILPLPGEQFFTAGR